MEVFITHVRDVCIRASFSSHKLELYSICYSFSIKTKMNNIDDDLLIRYINL